MAGLSREQIETVDASRLVDDVLAMPQHLEDALWRVESAGLEPALGSSDELGPLLICGMGGSAIGGDLAAAVLGERTLRPLRTVRGYELPMWAAPSSVVLCASYSGNTEETLACYEAAGALGAIRVAVTTGGRLGAAAREDGVPVIPLPAGLQPRAAVAYMLVSALEVAALSGVGLHVKTEIDAAASSLVDLAAEWGPDAPADSLAKRVAQRLHKTCVCVYGAGPTAPIAMRWKTQLNENAKVPAFDSALPELDHNELVGWSGAADLGRFSAVFLDDSDLHPRLRQRIELTRGLIGPNAASSFRVESRGETRMERLVSLVLAGDLVSLYLAVLRGVDPTPVEAIEQLKNALNGG
jgi:glucose/mannose-6-phosphate isomerase